MTREDLLREPELAPYVRRAFFEDLTGGRLTGEEAMAAARRLNLDIAAERYAIAVFTLPSAPREAADYLADPAAETRSRLLAYFYKYSEFIPIPWGADRCVVLILGAADQMPDLIRRCVDTVRSGYASGGPAGWHMAVSDPVDSLEELPACRRQAEGLWGLGCLHPGERVFRPGQTAPAVPADDGALGLLDPAGDESGQLEAFLRTGRREQVRHFVEGFLVRREAALGFTPYRHYLMLCARSAAARAVLDMDLSREALHRRLPPWEEDPKGLARYMEGVLTAALALRDEAKGAAYEGALGRAAAYVREHRADRDLSLAAAAAYAGVTPGHLSALFRKKLGVTFTEYVTARRMELARTLLRDGGLTVEQAAWRSGFSDARYFSTLFKRTQGCTPTQFRAGKNL